jgi:hypothetical protein
MSDPLFKYTSDPMDLATAGLIVDETERVSAADCGESEIRDALGRLDRLVTFLEGKVDRPARQKMIPALRVKAQLLLKLGDTATAVEHLEQALTLYARCGEDDPEAVKLVALLETHSAKFRQELAGLANSSGLVPSGC